MDFKARLTRLVAPPSAQGRPAPVPAPSRADARGRLSARTLPGSARATPHGEVQLCEAAAGPEERHGQVALGRMLAADAASLAKVSLDEALAALPLDGALFLDTETSGLSGGTGTLAFVVGVGFWDTGALRLLQYVLPGPGQERPLLLALGEHLARAAYVVTYNGKSFDWPLLRTRFVMNRLPPPRALPHLDLLHCMRRVFHRSLPAARLGDVEEHLLGFRRTGDVHGADIPEAWFSYLRSGNGGHLAKVVSHNALDLKAMAAALGHLLGAWEGSVPVRAPERLCLSLLAARLGEVERALGLAQGAAAEGQGAVRAEALELIAALRRKDGDARGAAEALHAAAPEASSPARVHLKLARLYEHALKDVHTALHHAQLARGAEEEGVHLRRVARLTRRAGRAG